MVFSCEMSAFQLVQRLVFARAKFAMSQLSRGYTPNKGDLQRIQRSCVETAAVQDFHRRHPGHFHQRAARQGPPQEAR
jgi:replicative DNA helicase